MQVSIINLLSNKRHLAGFVRTMELCSCGCGGYHTIWGMLDVVAWQLNALAQGVFPVRRHDSQEWDPGCCFGDEGGPMGFSAALIFVKGDWAEFSKSLGLRPWSVVVAPCTFCECCREDLHLVDQDYISSEGMVSKLRTHDDYELACQACEVKVNIVSLGMRDLVAGQLATKKKVGIVVKEDIAPLGIKAGDRLEASHDVRIPMDFASLDVPFSCVFWRYNYDEAGRISDFVSHRCPLFDADVLMTSPSRSLCNDVLHTIHLGILSRFVGVALTRLVQANPWKSSPDVAYKRMEADMFSWFERAKIPNSRRIGALTDKMMSLDRVKLKGSETFLVSEFVFDRLRHFHDTPILYRREMTKACEAIIAWVRTSRKAQARLTQSEFQSLCDYANRFEIYCKDARVSFTPKFFQFGHLTSRNRELNQCLVDAVQILK